jgi:hypothetical protein
LAIVLVIGNAWSADAAPGDADTTFVPITPCRLADTRPAPDRVGTEETFGADVTKTFPTHGSHGQCTIPAEAVGLSLNVTAVGATTRTFLTIWPGGPRPLASSLNPAPGQPPVPNAVLVPLAGDGSFSVYNLAGSVDVIIDVNGYSTKASLQEISSRLVAAEAWIADADSALAGAEATIASLVAEQPFVKSSRNGGMVISDSDTSVVSVSLTAPAAGNVTVMSTTTVREDTADQYVACSISAGTAFDTDFIQRWESPGSAGSDSQLAGTRVFDVTAGQAVTYGLVCKNLSAGGSSNVFDPTIAAIFTPAA